MRAALVALLLCAAACDRGPATAEAAYVKLERAVAAADATAFFPLLDQKSRAALDGLRRASSGESAEQCFRRLDRTGQLVAGYRRRLGSVSGPILTKPDGADAAWVARKDGMPFHFHRDPGGWAFDELAAEWQKRPEQP